VCSTTSGIGLALGAVGFNVLSASVALVSGDAGATWTDVTVQIQLAFRFGPGDLVGATCAGSSDLWIVGGVVNQRFRQTTDPKGMLLFHSADGGVTWDDTATSLALPVGFLAGLRSATLAVPSPFTGLDDVIMVP